LVHTTPKRYGLDSQTACHFANLVERASLLFEVVAEKGGDLLLLGRDPSAATGD
jgi:hypothetical protein